MNRILQHYDLTHLHTFRLPSKAHSIVTIQTPEDVESLPADAYLLGEGSNTLFLMDFARPIALIRLKGIQIKEFSEYWEVRAAAGEHWHELVVSLTEQGVWGLENLALIPGTLGAAPVQNIGAYGVEIAQFIKHVHVWDREHKVYQELLNADCQFEYRDSIFKQQPNRWIILAVTLCIPKRWQPVLSYGELTTLPASPSALEVMAKVIEVRRNKLPDPQYIPNAGSFFKNPEVSYEFWEQLSAKYPTMPHYKLQSGKVKLAAGWLIDQLQLKGYRLGGAAVHHRQALVLVNMGDAVGEDVIQLAGYIQQQVWEAYGVKLETEVRLLGQNGLVTL